MKKILSAMLMLVLVFCLSITAFGAISGEMRGYCGEYGDNMEWILSDDGTLTITGWGNMANYSRNEPAPWYNQREVITKLVFDGDVNSIGNHAFTDCSNITGILELPENLYSIGFYAFEDCTGLSGDLVLPNNLHLIEDGAFYNCTGFNGELVIGERNERIGHYAFYGCTGFEKDAVIPQGVDYIGNYAFKNCGVDNFFFYTEAPELEEGFEKRPPFDKEKDTIYCFISDYGWDRGEGKPWNGFTLKENERNIASGYCGAEEGGKNLQWVIEPDGTVVISGKGPMENYTEAEEAPWMEYNWYIYDVVIEEGVTTIGNYAFADANLHNEPLFLPSTLESIGDYAFKNCSYIWRSLVVPKNVKNIGTYAFQGCKCLDSLVLPEGLVAIGAGAFNDCKDMGGSVVIPSTVWTIGDEAFKNCGVNEFFISGMTTFREATAENPTFDSFDVLHLQTEEPVTEHKGYSADNVGKDEIIDSGNIGAMGEQLEVTWSLTASGKLTIGGTGRMRDFEEKYIDFMGWATTAPWVQYNSKITSIVIEEGVKYIGAYAFFALDHAANELILPESLEGIGNYAFNGCNNLYGKLRIPSNLKEIGEGAFGYCFALTGDLIIPESVVTLGENAFDCCRGFDGKLVIPKSIGTIAKKTFSGCYRLTSLEIAEGITEIGEEAFYACRALKGDLVIPNSVETIREGAFESCEGFDGKLILGTGLKRIEPDAFRYCERLTGDITIPDNVTYLGPSAFEFCKSFDGKIKIGSGISGLFGDVFRDCEMIDKEVTIPANIKSLGTGTFENCGGKYYTFEGDAPETVYEAADSSATFDADYDVIVYPKGNSTWVIEDTRWKGYMTQDSVSASVLYGDIDGNGKINVLDANMVRRATAKLAELSDEQTAAADVDGNGKINVLDANLIRRYVAKLVDSFPAEA
ncbi:MAG: leucine-rich repeat protein [Oscillospiraceae bacterium]|nr:leucine-rich repeat protein [Oscillospiraceae bacterium]